MGRSEARQQAVLFLFENSFNNLSLEDIIINSGLNYEEVDSFVEKIFNGVLENIEEIDSFIERNLKNWGKNRLSKIAMAILRESTYEILYRKDIPISVSINEAVELAKKYGAEQESSFVNGILGAISKEVGEKSE